MMRRAHRWQRLSGSEERVRALSRALATSPYPVFREKATERLARQIVRHSGIASLIVDRRLRRGLAKKSRIAMGGKRTYGSADER